eukprot:8175114-Ditylum_brightwellii.AAC.1
MAGIKDRDNTVMVFIDESYIHKYYIHKYHQQKFSSMHEESEINKKSGSGNCLIILHAITEDGPLTEYKLDGSPVDSLEWNGNTLHPID